MSGKIAAYVNDTHYLGGVKHARGEWLNGWPCCCTGKRVRKIMASGAPLTWNASEVTCKGCLQTMAKAPPTPPVSERPLEGLPGWRTGVEDSIRHVRAMQCKPRDLWHKAYFAALDELLVHLEAMLERGSARSTTELQGDLTPTPAQPVKGR